MTRSDLPHDGPEASAAEALREALRSQWEGTPALRLDSPPGAGKTGLVELLAAQSLGRLGERCAIATLTNAQCFDLARRLSEGFPRLRFTLWVKKGLEVPLALQGRQNLSVVDSINGLPTGPCVVLANATKWSSLSGDVPTFDVLIVDEAFQLPDYRFQLIAVLARRYVLVGDPGQIAPVVTCAVERWRCDPAGPQVACPEALVTRHPWVRRLTLPVSRRLVPDTVSIVQPAFYPGLPFRALSAPGERGVSLEPGGGHPLDAVLDLVASGASLALAELPPKTTGEVDEALADTIVSAIDRLSARGARVRDRGGERAFDPGQIGVVCAHVAQVNAVRERLLAGHEGVLVETAERFQGIERPLMLVHHPLSGRAEAGEFQLNAGRLCVMTTRHRVACILFARAGLGARWARHAVDGERVLNLKKDAEYEGWRANLAILRALEERRRRVVVVSHSLTDRGRDGP